MKSSATTFAGRAMRLMFAFIFVIGLTPLQSFAATSSEDTTSQQSTTYSEIAEAEQNGECIAGQALVVYHASGAQKGATGDLAIQSDSDPLSDAGFSATETWDLSQADSMAESTGADTDGALSVQSEESGSTIASGSDVRVALIERDDMSVADLVTSLEKLDFVECAAPNYCYNSTSLTNDTYSDSQWGLSGTDSEIGGSTYGIDYTSALIQDTPTTTTQDSVVVAVLDTGVDYTNPDLADQMWTDPGNI